MTILKELLLAGAAQGLLLAAVILTLRPSVNPTANRLLALIVGLESAHLFFLYMSYSIPGATPLSFRALFGLRVLDAPALFLYACALTDDRFRFERAQLRHLWVMLPVLALLLYVGSFQWPAFNVADTAIVCGSGLLLIDLLRPKRQAANVP